MISFPLPPTFFLKRKKKKVGGRESRNLNVLAFGRPPLLTGKNDWWTIKGGLVRTTKLMYKKERSPKAWKVFYLWRPSLFSTSLLGLTLAHIFSSFPRNISFLCYAEMKKKTLRGKEERISARARPGKISASL